MHPVIPLWSCEAPYTAESNGQAQPSVKAFPVEGSRCAIVVCPGGGYTMKAEYEGDPIAEWLNTIGISAYVLDYRVFPCHYLTPLTDALRAIRVVRSMGYEKVGIMGFSAGGHLTCTAATLYTEGDPDAEDPIERLSSRPDAFIPCYPVVSLYEYPHIGSRVSLIGSPANDPAFLRKFSANQNVTKDTPPAFIWHTANDEIVPVENSLLLATALSAKGVPFELHIFPDGRHGLDLARDLPVVHQWVDLCRVWLTNQGFTK